MSETTPPLCREDLAEVLGRMKAACQVDERPGDGGGLGVGLRASAQPTGDQSDQSDQPPAAVCEYTDAERAGLADLTANVCAELDGLVGASPADIAWIVEAALFQLGCLIRRQAITVPDLGTFARRPRTVGTGHVIDFEPCALLLEDSL